VGAYRRSRRAAEATAALARAYLYSDLSPDDRAATEGALIMSLDDPSPLCASRSHGRSPSARMHRWFVILGLAVDQPEVAGWVLPAFALDGRR